MAYPVKEKAGLYINLTKGVAYYDKERRLLKYYIFNNKNIKV